MCWLQGVWRANWTQDACNAAGMAGASKCSKGEENRRIEKRKEGGFTQSDKRTWETVIKSELTWVDPRRPGGWIQVRHTSGSPVLLLCFCLIPSSTLAQPVYSLLNLPVNTRIITLVEPSRLLLLLFFGIWHCSFYGVIIKTKLRTWKSNKQYSCSAL